MATEVTERITLRLTRAIGIGENLAAILRQPHSHFVCVSLTYVTVSTCRPASVACDVPLVRCGPYVAGGRPKRSPLAIHHL